MGLFRLLLDHIAAGVFTRLLAVGPLGIWGRAVSAVFHCGQEVALGIRQVKKVGPVGWKVPGGPRFGQCDGSCSGSEQVKGDELD